MYILADTGILLRLIDRGDMQHTDVRQAVSIIRQRGDASLTSPQNAAEFWAVCTRPATARGGLGLEISEADRRLRLIARIFPVLLDSPSAYNHWRNLVIAPGAKGVQAHDARIAAFMTAYGLTHILTLNAAGFARYPAIIPLTPADIIYAAP